MSNTDTKRESILEDRNAKNMNRATKSSMAIFTNYLKEKNYPELNEIEDKDLPDIMLEFYSNLKKVDGEDCVQSMKYVHMCCDKKAELGIDFISIKAYIKADEILCGVNKQKRIKGLGSTKSTPVIFLTLI